MNSCDDPQGTVVIIPHVRSSHKERTKEHGKRYQEDLRLLRSVDRR
nr:MAG TPA: hypothetical protein [Caudoviricetes sp.]